MLGFFHHFKLAYDLRVRNSRDEFFSLSDDEQLLLEFHKFGHFLFAHNILNTVKPIVSTSLPSTSTPELQLRRT